MGSTRTQLTLAFNVCSSLSIVASSVICLKYFYFPALRSRSAKLVMWLSLSNIGLSISIICGINHEFHVKDNHTDIFAFLINFFLLGNVFWTTAITKTMALVILQRNKLLSMLSQQTVTPKTMAVKRMLSFHIYIFALSAVLSGLPIAFRSYANFTDDWRWYKSNKGGEILSAICYYGPLLVGTVYNIYVLCSLVQVKSFFVDNGMNLADRQSLTGQLYELAMSLKNYPIVTSLICIWALVVEIVYLASGTAQTDRHFGLQLSLAIVQSSQGVFHVIIYFYRSYRRGTLWSKDEGLCGLCCGCEINADDNNGDGMNVLRQLSLPPTNQVVAGSSGTNSAINSRNSSRNFSGGSATGRSKTPNLADIERAADAICPVFANRNGDDDDEYTINNIVDIETFNILAAKGYCPPIPENSNTPSSHSRSALASGTYSSRQVELNSEYVSNAFRPSGMTLGPNPGSISVRIGDESDGSANSLGLSANADMLAAALTRGNRDDSFGICLED